MYVYGPAFYPFSFVPAMFNLVNLPSVNCKLSLLINLLFIILGLNRAHKTEKNISETDENVTLVLFFWSEKVNFG